MATRTPKAPHPGDTVRAAAARYALRLDAHQFLLRALIGRGAPWRGRWRFVTSRCAQVGIGGVGNLGAEIHVVACHRPLTGALAAGTQACFRAFALRTGYRIACPRRSDSHLAVSETVQTERPSPSTAHHAAPVATVYVP